MNKILRYSFVALLAMVFAPSFAEDIIWEEDFSSYANDPVPSGGTYNYVCTDNGTNLTKIYDANLAGGTAPELLVGKKNTKATNPKVLGTFAATVNLGDKSGDMTLSFKSNGNLTITVEGGTVGENTGTGNDYVYPITEASGTLTITFTNNTSSNIRLDDIKLAQGDSKKPAGLSWGTSSRTVTIGAEGNQFPTLKNENNLAVTYNSSDQTVATIAADGTITLVAAGKTTIKAESAETDEYEAGKAEYELTVKEPETPAQETTAANIAALNALNNNDIFTYTSDVAVVYLNGAYAYIKDETGSSLIYDKNKTKLANLAIGKKVAANWKGKVSIYNKLFEAVPDDVLSVTEDAAIEVTYPEATMSDMIAANMNQVVIIKNVTYTAPSGKNFTIAKAEDTVKGYNTFGIEIAAPTEGKTYNITGVISVYNTNIQFLPIAIEEAAAETKYTITITNTEHGSLTLDKYEAAEGEKVSVTYMTTDDGWYMDQPTITAENGAEVTIGGDDKEGHYIIMPASNITIALNIKKYYTITTVFNSEQGDVTGITFNSEDNPIYKKEGKNIQFTVTAKQGFEVESVTAADADNTSITVNVAADKSYYEFEMPAKDVIITATFATATGISAVAAAKAENAVRYNAAGQMVTSSYKGLVIVNGKKMIQK